MLHGAMPRGAREESLRRFASGDATLLLATDAGGEGLNLQQRCRLVINIELPWNPNRLEQRIGRVDRLGQTRTVHAIHLVLADTGEDTLRETLATRVARIEDALTSPVASPSTEKNSVAIVWPSLRIEARQTVRALEQLRALRADPPSRDGPDLDSRSPWIAHLRRHKRHTFHSSECERDCRPCKRVADRTVHKPSRRTFKAWCRRAKNWSRATSKTPPPPNGEAFI